MYKVSPIIAEKLINDKEFRLKTAIALKIGERSVMNSLYAESDNLTKYAAILVFRQYGFKEKEMFVVKETETVAA